MLGAGLIGRRLECAEQEVQPARLVGADLRQLARRLRRFFLLPGRRSVQVLRKGNGPASPATMAVTRIANRQLRAAAGNLSAIGKV